MTAQTEVLPDSLKALEFQPKCEAYAGRCSEAAEWAVLTICSVQTCAQRQRFMCTPHTDLVARLVASNTHGSCCYCNERVYSPEYYLSWTRL